MGFMKYQFLTQEEMDDAIAEAMYNREREHYNYALNIANFRDMLANMPAEADTWKVGDGKETYRQYITRLLAEHEAEQAKVEKIYEALAQRLPAGPRRDAAIQRLTAKRTATPRTLP